MLLRFLGILLSLLPLTVARPQPLFGRAATSDKPFMPPGGVGVNASEGPPSYIAFSDFDWQSLVRQLLVLPFGFLNVSLLEFGFES